MSFEPGVRALLKRNPNYWKEGAAHFDEAECLAVIDPTARTNALTTGEVDLMDRVDYKTVNLLGRNKKLRVEEVTGAPLMAIDFGGGLGVPHYKEETPLDMAKLGAEVEGVFEPFSKREGCRLILELGRYLMSESGIFVSRVIELKESRGQRFIITDGGINQFVRPVLMKVTHEARVVNKLASPTEILKCHFLHHRRGPDRRNGRRRGRDALSQQETRDNYARARTHDCA